MIIFYCLFNLLVVGGLGYLMWRQEPELPLKKICLPAFCLKIAAGILLGVFYQVYFGGGDAQIFQEQANLVTEYARISPASYLRLLLTRQYESETLRTSMIYVWYSNSYFVVMVLSGLNFITGNNFILNGLYFSVFCFWGLWQLVRVLYQRSAFNKWPAVIAFLFFPSVVFWSSGISKEAIYLGSLGWLLAAGLPLIYGLAKYPWWNCIAVLLAGYLLWKIKFYFAALVFALFFGYGLIIYLSRYFRLFKPIWAKIIMFLTFTLIAGLIVAGWSEVFKLDYLAAQLIKSNQFLTQQSFGKPLIYFPELKPTLISFIQHSLPAIYNTMLRPFIWEENSFFYLIAGLENLIILILILLSLIKLGSNFSWHINLGALAILIYVITLAVLIGLSTPNIGSLNRYRVAFLPFLIFLLLRVLIFRKNAQEIKL